jgi:hypothetical protein
MTTVANYPLEELIDNSSSMSPSQVFLSRRLARERVDCPNCRKSLTLATLSWSHKCKVLADAKFQVKLAEMHKRAHQNFQARNQPTPERMEDVTKPTEDAC